jgi:hypothetical protein
VAHQRVEISRRRENLLVIQLPAIVRNEDDQLLMDGEVPYLVSHLSPTVHRQPAAVMLNTAHLFPIELERCLVLLTVVVDVE